MASAGQHCRPFPERRKDGSSAGWMVRVPLGLFRKEGWMLLASSPSSLGGETAKRPCFSLWIAHELCLCYINSCMTCHGSAKWQFLRLSFFPFLLFVCWQSSWPSKLRRGHRQGGPVACESPRGRLGRITPGGSDSGLAAASAAIPSRHPMTFLGTKVEFPKSIFDVEFDHWQKRSSQAAGCGSIPSFNPTDRSSR